MKRIISLVLVLVLMCCGLVSCGMDISTEIDKNYNDAYNKWSPEDPVHMELNMYVVKGEGTTARGIKDVNDRVNIYLNTNEFYTTLNIHYISEDEYSETISVVTDPEYKADYQKNPDDYKDKHKPADIVLINSEEMFDNLYTDNKIANLKDLLTASYKYGTLNTQIANALISGAKFNETWIKSETMVEGEKVIETEEIPVIYSVPNNRVVGYYEYVLVDREAAKFCNFGTDIIAKMVSEDCEEVAMFKASVESANLDFEDCFKVVRGTYGDKAKYEEKYYVNVASTPVISEAEVYESAFAITRHASDLRYKKSKIVEDEEISVQAKNLYTEYYERCMDVIYEINTSPELRNLLLYGVDLVHYNSKIVENEDGTVSTFVNRIIPSEEDTEEEDERSIYIMDSLYTGDIFMAYYCDELGWTEQIAEDGAMQNKEAVFVSSKK